MRLQAFTDPFLGMQPLQGEGKRVSLFLPKQKGFEPERLSSGCAGQSDPNPREAESSGGSRAGGTWSHKEHRELIPTCTSVLPIGRLLVLF